MFFIEKDSNVLLKSDASLQEGLSRQVVGS